MRGWGRGWNGGCGIFGCEHLGWARRCHGEIVSFGELEDDFERGLGWEGEFVVAVVLFIVSFPGSSGSILANFVVFFAVDFGKGKCESGSPPPLWLIACIALIVLLEGCKCGLSSFL